MIVFLLFLFSLLTPPHILAIDPVVEPTKTTTNSDEIKKIREAVQKKVQEKLKQIVTPTTSIRSLIGTVVEITDKQIAFEYQNTKQLLQVSDETVFIDSKRNKTKFENIKVGQGILSMGNLNDEGVLETKRLVFTDLKTLENKKQTVVGMVVDISKSSSVFTLIPTKNKNSQYQIKTDQNTKIENKDSKELGLKDLVSGQKLIVVLQPDENTSKTFYASKIIRLSN
jgi:hypothetical protein